MYFSPKISIKVCSSMGILDLKNAIPEAKKPAKETGFSRRS
jgi:hypothetical protein